MEQIDAPFSARGGFMLVTVLVLTAIGLLFGAGALLRFKFQCQMRIDRQHELEKVYAVRSSLNFIKTARDIPEEGRSFLYRTGSGRSLPLYVKPVEPVFPVLTNEHHFAMQREGDYAAPSAPDYYHARDYEYGALGVTNHQTCSFLTGAGFGLGFEDLSATNTVKWWVNVGMPETGGWLQEDYGRRYCFEPWAYVDGDNTSSSGVKDIMRLCIIRNVTNESNEVGYRHGWPLSKDGERALVFEICPNAGGKNKSNESGEDGNARMTLREYVCYGGTIDDSKILLSLNSTPTMCPMGVQIADNKVTLCYMDNKADGKGNNKPYTMSATTNMTLNTYKYFSEPVLIGSKWYDGVTNIEGRVHAPELRAVFEIEARSDLRTENSSPKSGQLDFLTNFRVTPAYQYDVFIEHPAGVTNLATVAQKLGLFSERDMIYPAVLTYDTHGTEHKGFRRDERLARKGGE